MVVACDGPEFEDSSQDILLNPVVLMEVLSPATEKNDRSWKFAHYRHLECISKRKLTAILSLVSI